VVFDKIIGRRLKPAPKNAARLKKANLKKLLGHWCINNTNLLILLFIILKRSRGMDLWSTRNILVLTQVISLWSQARLYFSLFCTRHGGMLNAN
jgi:hypothetical protein